MPDNNIYKLWAAVIALLIFFVGGCARTVSMPPPAPVTLEQVISWLASRDKKADSLKAYASVTVTDGDRRQSFRAALILKKPQSLRLEILNPLHQPVQYFVCNQRQITAYKPGEKQAFQGDPTSLNVYRLLGIRVEIAEFVSALLGLPPIPNYYDRFKLLGGELSPRPVLDACFEDKGCPYRLWIDPWLRYPVRLGQNKEDSWIINWSDFSLMQDYYLPGHIEMLRNDQDFGLEITYSNPQLNPELEDTAFNLELPPGVEIASLDGPPPIINP